MSPTPPKTKAMGCPNIITIMRTASIKIDIVSALKNSIIAPSRERKGAGSAQTGQGLAAT